MPLTEPDFQALCRDVAAGKPSPDPLTQPERAALNRTTRETLMLIGSFRSLVGSRGDQAYRPIQEPSP